MNAVGRHMPYIMVGYLSTPSQMRPNTSHAQMRDCMANLRTPIFYRIKDTHAFVHLASSRWKIKQTAADFNFEEQLLCLFQDIHCLSSLQWRPWSVLSAWEPALPTITFKDGCTEKRNKVRLDKFSERSCSCECSQQSHCGNYTCTILNAAAIINMHACCHLAHTSCQNLPGLAIYVTDTVAIYHITASACDQMRLIVCDENVFSLLEGWCSKQEGKVCEETCWTISCSSWKCFCISPNCLQQYQSCSPIEVSIDTSKMLISKHHVKVLRKGREYV